MTQLLTKITHKKRDDSKHDDGIVIIYPSALCLGLFAAMFGAPSSHAQTNHTQTVLPTPAAKPNTAQPTAPSSVQLDTVVVVGKKRTKKSEEITGLGKSVKSKKDLDRAQVLSIRDLVQDTPGVAVVEQGRGASTGYTMRGVDKNRVAVSVDGIAQIQSYLVQKRDHGDGREGSGAINEIELENIATAQISQGANGSEFGSGALGGAVSFYTKGASDVLDDNKSLGFSYKTSYASKDHQKLHSIGAAVKKDDLDAFVQYTHRTKTQIHPHHDIFATKYEVWRQGGYASDFNSGAIKPDDNPERTFVLTDECPSYIKGDADSIKDCIKPKVNTQPVKETIWAQDYTGDKRVLPDPMDYQSKSYLAKIGYNLPSPKPKRVQAVLEHTTQYYSSRDMTKTAYHLYTGGRGNLANSSFVYRGQNFSEGFNTEAVNAIGNSGIGMWSQAQFFNETHQKKRYGLGYIQQGIGLIDEFSLNIDHQDVGIDHLQVEKHCAPYPAIDKNCTPSADKPNSAMRQNRKTYREKHTLWRMGAQKAYSHQFGDTKIRHKLSLDAGVDRFSSNLWIGDILEDYHHVVFSHQEDIKNANGKFIDIYKSENRHISQNICDPIYQKSVGEARKCGDRLITGNNHYAMLKDTISIAKYADISASLRVDKHTFNSDDPWSGTGNFYNRSYNLGVVIKPARYVDLMYRASSGYRVPSFKELFGYRMDGNIKGKDDDKHHRTDASAEKSINQEIGILLKGDVGNLQFSYFDNRYKDLIALTLKDDKWGYRNYQDVHLAGFNIGTQFEAKQLFANAPEGLIGKFNMNHTEVRHNQVKSGFRHGQSYFLDSLSPDRYVAALDYDDPSGKWGANATWTFVDAKDPSQLQAQVHSGTSTYTKSASELTSQSYDTLDVSAFYRPKGQITLRAGINNLLNQRYSTWEAMRQSAITSGNQHTQGLSAQYAGAGRNFVFSLETKF